MIYLNPHAKGSILMSEACSYLDNGTSADPLRGLVRSIA